MRYWNDFGETCRHFPTRVSEHLVSDRASHIFKHLKDSAHCRALCSADNFHVLDHASAGYSYCKSKTIFLILTLMLYLFSFYPYLS